MIVAFCMPSKERSLVVKGKIGPEGFWERVGAMDESEKVRLLHVFLNDAKDRADYFARCLAVIGRNSFSELKLEVFRVFEPEKWEVKMDGKGPVNIWTLGERQLFPRLKEAYGPILTAAGEDDEPMIRVEATKVMAEVGVLACSKRIVAEELIKDLCTVVDSESDGPTLAKKLKLFLAFTQDPAGVRAIYDPKLIDRAWRLRINRFINDPYNGPDALWLIHDVLIEQNDIFVRVSGRKPFNLESMRTVVRNYGKEFGIVKEKKLQSMAQEFIVDLGVRGDRELCTYIMEKLAREYLKKRA